MKGKSLVPVLILVVILFSIVPTQAHGEDQHYLGKIKKCIDSSNKTTQRVGIYELWKTYGDKGG